MEEGKDVNVFLNCMAFNLVAFCISAMLSGKNSNGKHAVLGGQTSGQPQPLESKERIPESIEPERALNSV